MENVVKARKLDPSHDLIQKLLFDVIPRVSDVRDNLDFLFNDFCNQFMRAARISILNSRESEKIRITNQLRSDRIWREECESLLNAMNSELVNFVDLNRKLYEAFEELDENVVKLLINPMLEWNAQITRMDSLRRTVINFLGDGEGYCRWVELFQRRTGKQELIARLCIAPVDVRTVLKESLHDRMKSEILTSATLTVDRNFSFFEERSGLPQINAEKPKVALDEDGYPITELDPVEARPVSTTLLSSPFNFREQVFFAVPTDMPDPRAAEFEDRLVDLIDRSVAVSGGRAFILFTSYGQLKRVADRCEPTIRRLGIEVLRQGTDSRDLLLRKFREDETSVLFATSSFWEGVDVRGRSLELLVIAKLPFAVPTEPIQEAQFEALKAKGRDPFDSLVVPRAVIRLKQGFGRLIRAKTDRGGIIVADKRVVQMRYGRRFIHSLPDLDVRKGMVLDLMDDMRDFFSTAEKVRA